MFIYSQWIARDHLNGLFLNSKLTQFLDRISEGLDPSLHTNRTSTNFSGCQYQRGTFRNTALAVRWNGYGPRFPW